MHVDVSLEQVDTAECVNYNKPNRGRRASFLTRWAITDVQSQFVTSN